MSLECPVHDISTYLLWNLIAHINKINLDIIRNKRKSIGAQKIVCIKYLEECMV